MEWFERAEIQGGAVSREQLRDGGVSDSTITRWSDTGVLRDVRHGVFLVRGAPDTFETRLWIAALSTEGVLGFATAAHLWGMDDRPDRIHVIVGPDRRVLRLREVRLHHVLVPQDERTELRGLPITSMRWTILDHLGRQPPGRALRLADRALQRGWISRHDVVRRVKEFPGRQGNVRLRRILDVTADGAAAQSERQLHALLNRAGIRGWRANHPVRIGDRVVALIDLAFVSARLAIEVDGMAHHTDVERFQRDRERQNLLTGLGWTVIRFTWFDLVERPDYVLATIRAHLPRS